MTKRMTAMNELVAVAVLALAYGMAGCSSPSTEPPDMTLDLGNGVTMKLVLIHPGKFTMGSPDSEKGRKSNETQHEVTISKPFYMGALRPNMRPS